MKVGCYLLLQSGPDYWSFLNIVFVKEIFIMFEKYYEYKSKYKDYVIFIKAGTFYETLEKDALILSELLGYKIKRFSKSFKCGFPVSKIDDVLNVIKKNKINYLVIGNEVSKVNFTDNKYTKYNFDVNKILFNYLRIDKITKYLNDNVLDSKIDDILGEMEKIL